MAHGASGRTPGHHHLGPGFVEPGSSVFWEAVRELEPTLYRGFAPWDEITTPEALGRLLQDGGA
ncbi:MAG TPA: hypothetical protein VE571_11785, partial [Solirubrobacteraceae bacterium]|nr:hypothetical protein [Solirubrobacteraceae bacterium]